MSVTITLRDGSEVAVTSATSIQGTSALDADGNTLANYGDITRSIVLDDAVVVTPPPTEGSEPAES